jgi:hypothetical protein
MAVPLIVTGSPDAGTPLNALPVCVPCTVQLETIRSSASIKRFTLNTMSGNASRVSRHHCPSEPRMSVPTAAGLTRGVT